MSRVPETRAAAAIPLENGIGILMKADTVARISGVAPYSWTVREGSFDGPVVMREYIYDVPDKEPVQGQEIYLSNGSGPWRVTFREQVPNQPRSPYNTLVVESLDA